VIAPARRAAFDLLHEIATTDAHSDDLLRSRAIEALSPQDRNLVTNLVMGTLRWQLSLEEAIVPLLSRPNQRLSDPVQVALRLGAFQLLHLDRLPAHAVLHDSVELVKQSSERHAAGLVNAVLRKIAALPRSTGNPEHAHPEWMVERWRKQYGPQAAAAICRYDQEPGPTTLRVLDTEAIAELQHEGIEFEPGALLSRAVRVLRGDVTRTQAFRSGRCRIQEEGSQLVAEIAAAASPLGLDVLDACAAPGGKTAILAERLPNAKILALDVSPRRLEQMKRLLARWAPRINFAAADAVKIPDIPKYDLILCDAPCSGTGTMARNPEIRLRVQPEDLRRQQKRQLAILRAVAEALAPGGRLVYSTCSLEPEENEAVVERLLSDGAMRLVPMQQVLESMHGAGALTTGGMEMLRSSCRGQALRTIPGMQPCDGFYVAVLER
jgi:16S rRNA (cytosine967-C5)-methyltransferase